MADPTEPIVIEVGEITFSMVTGDDAPRHEVILQGEFDPRLIEGALVVFMYHGKRTRPFRITKSTTTQQLFVTNCAAPEIDCTAPVNPVILLQVLNQLFDLTSLEEIPGWEAPEDDMPLSFKLIELSAEQWSEVCRDADMQWLCLRDVVHRGAPVRRNGTTLLHHACSTRSQIDAKLLQMLVVLGFGDTTEKDAQQRNALALAVRNRRLQLTDKAVARLVNDASVTHAWRSLMNWHNACPDYHYPYPLPAFVNALSTVVRDLDRLNMLVKRCQVYRESQKG